MQNPVVPGDHQEPQPDFAVLRYRADGYGAGLPQAADILLVAEVADTSAPDDRERKTPKLRDGRLGARVPVVPLPGPH